MPLRMILAFKKASSKEDVFMIPFVSSMCLPLYLIKVLNSLKFVVQKNTVPAQASTVVLNFFLLIVVV